MQPFVPVEALFKGRHFDGQIIILCVSWYTICKLSLRDLVIMMADRGIALTHTTILRWVQRYVAEFEKRWNRYARPVNGSWRCDETYIDIYKGEGTLDLSVSSGRQIRANGGFPVERTTGRGRCQTLLPQSNKTQRNASSDHSGRVRGFASSRPRTEIRGQPIAPCAAPIE